MTCSLLRLIRGRQSSILLLLLALVLISLPGAATAQSVTSARIVSFTPSPDHHRVLADGRAMVDGYVFAVYQAGATQPFETLNIGKPAPASDLQIHYDFSATVSSWADPGGTYESRVYAVGPGGTLTSSVSNTFTVAQSCSVTLAPSSASFPPAGGGGSISVATSTGCAWTAKSNVSWVTINSAGTSGNGTVIYTVTANTGSSNRSGTLTIGNATYTVSQQGAGCGYSLSSYTQSVPASGGASSVAVTASTGCSWTATSNTSWITVTGGGSGNGTVTYTAGANATTASRTGTLTVAGFTLTVNQPGTAAGTALPSPWRQQDVGTPGVRGSASFSVGVFTVSGAGNSLVTTSDSLHLVYQPVADVRLVARIASLSAASSSAKAGLMLRQSMINANGREVTVAVRPGGRVDVVQRTAAGSQARVVASIQTAATWLKLTRTGSTVTVSTSANGTTWTIIATMNCGFTVNGYAGLAVTSAQSTTLSVAKFDNVSLR